MSYGKMNVDWEERIQYDRMRKEKVQKARAALKKHGLDAVLILRGDNARYVAQNTGNTRNMPATGLRYVFLPNDGMPVLYEFGMWYPYVKENCPWLVVKPAAAMGGSGGGTGADFYPPEAYGRQLEVFAGQIKKEMKDHGLAGQKLGIDAGFRPMVDALNKVGIEVSLEGGKALMEARTIKTKDEVECLRMAASIVEGGWRKVKEALKPGVTEMDLRGIYMGECYRQGAENVASCDIYSGPRGWCNNIITSDRAIRPGDLVVLLGCNLSYMGYKTCYYRTFMCGKPTQDQKDTYARVRDYLYDAIRIVKPGVTTKQLAEKWPKAEEYGYEDENAAMWIQWGHGIGLSQAEPPTVTRLWSLDYPEKLQAGMTIALETWLPTRERSGTYPRGQSVRIEEMLAVTESGYDLLTSWPIDELTVCEF
jgi:Xaa-Pro dipeptidase